MQEEVRLLRDSLESMLQKTISRLVLGTSPTGVVNTLGNRSNERDWCRQSSVRVNMGPYYLIIAISITAAIRYINPEMDDTLARMSASSNLTILNAE